MSELTPYSETQDLLHRLCGFGDEAEALPANLLCKMYKGVLQRPLEVLADLVEFPSPMPGLRGAPLASNGQLSAIYERYPAMLHTFNAESRQLKQLYRQVDITTRPLWEQANGQASGVGTRAIFYKADRMWIGSWPAILLHRFTWDAQPMAPLLAMMETMLQAERAMTPILHRIVLERGGNA